MVILAGYQSPWAFLEVNPDCDPFPVLPDYSDIELCESPLAC